jgi:hypothetical protein
MLQLSRTGTVITCDADTLAAARNQFETYAYLRLPQFIEPGLLAQILDRVDRTEFYARTHEGIGTELCARSGTVTGALEFMMNDPVLRAFVAGLAGCGPLGCYEGRIYRLNPADGHYDSWHSDVGQDRQLALSINLSRLPFEGGRLQIRRADSEDVLAEVDNPVTGDAVMFRVHPSMRHRVASVSGRNPRTAWAGWFKTTPEFRELLSDRLRQ